MYNYQKDVDQEVSIAATLEEDTNWWQDDGKTIECERLVG
jgi:hypothetical protein